MKNTNGGFPQGFVPFHLLSKLPPDEPMLIALSGGADSRMLFELAARHCRLNGSRFYACHVNHGIRGDEAIRDRDFCVALAESCEECADIFVLNASVPSLAAERGMSIEQCARLVRYDFFDEVMQKNGIRVLVTAHNADDMLETLIFNLTRGSGARGMCGIPATRTVANGILIRPMLSISKNEVLDFCEENRLAYVTDSTNAMTEYTRNLIRARIVPLLEEINLSVRSAASRMADAMNELWTMTRETAEDLVSTDGSLSLSELRSADPRLLPYVFHAAADRYGVDLEAVHVEALKGLAINGKDGKSLSLPGNFRALIHGDRLLFESNGDEDAPIAFDIPLSEGVTELPNGSVSAERVEGGYRISISVFPNEKKLRENINVYKLDITAHIMFDTIKWQSDSLRLRTRVSGDRILSGGVRKSVKKLMCDKKLPVSLRDVTPMLVSGNEILWIPTVATADKVKIKPNN